MKAGHLTLVNHYTASSTTTPSYTDTFGSTDFDGNGNELRTGKASSGATNSTLAYYPDNRLSSDTTSGTAETSSYDGSGRLVARNTGSDDWVFGYDGDQGITDSEYVTVSSEWYTKAERMETPAVQLAAAYSSGSVTVQYNLYDTLGNVAEATDSTGAPLGAFTADLYGRTSGTAEHNWLGQQGYRYRSTSSVYQVGYRVYDPAQGRFLQQDPMSFGEGDFTYVGNDTADKVDPSGMSILDNRFLACQKICEGSRMFYQNMADAAWRACVGRANNWLKLLTCNVVHGSATLLNNYTYSQCMNGCMQLGTDGPNHPPAGYGPYPGGYNH